MSQVAGILCSPALTALSRARIERLYRRIARFLAPLLNDCSDHDREHASEMLVCSLVLLSTEAKLLNTRIEALSLKIVAGLLDAHALTKRKRVVDLSQPH
jgi:hypothetical protein